MTKISILVINKNMRLCLCIVGALSDRPVVQGCFPFEEAEIIDETVF